jgi:hypothetical protein
VRTRELFSAGVVALLISSGCNERGPKYDKTELYRARVGADARIATLSLPFPVKMLAGQSKELVERQIELLAEGGDSYICALAEGLDEKDPYVRYVCLVALNRIGRLSPGGAPFPCYASGAFADPKRMREIYPLVEYDAHIPKTLPGTEGGGEIVACRGFLVPLLIKELGDENGALRRIAIWSLRYAFGNPTPKSGAYTALLAYDPDALSRAERNRIVNLWQEWWKARGPRVAESTP